MYVDTKYICKCNTHAMCTCTQAHTHIYTCFMPATSAEMAAWNEPRYETITDAMQQPGGVEIARQSQSAALA